MNRREFLKQTARTTILASSIGFEIAAGGAVDAASRSGADWPMYRGDTCLTGRAKLPGAMRSAPRLAWKHKIEAGQSLVVLDPAPGQNSRPAELLRKDLKPDYFNSDEGRKWPLGPPLVDLYGTGRPVPDPGRAAKLLPNISGLQTIEFQTAPNTPGLDPKQAVCFAYDGGQKREIWRSEIHDTIQNTNFAIADVDHDGKLEVILAPHYRVIVYDGQTGRTKHLLKIHNLRNYGFFCCTDLTGTGLLDFVIIADFAMHMDVVKNEGDHLRLLWRRDLEKEIQSKSMIVRPGPNPVFDLNGDGRKEILFNLFNQTGDGQWHLVAYDALTGENVLDLPKQYLSGATDVNQDGIPELFTTRTSALHVPTRSELQLLRIHGRQATTLWTRTNAQWVCAETILPLTHASIVAHGRDDIVTSRISGPNKANFLTLETHRGRTDRLSGFQGRPGGQFSETFQLDLPARSRVELRAVADVDGDKVDELLCAFRHPDSQRARVGRARNATTRLVSMQPAVVRQYQVGAGENRPLIVAAPAPKRRPLVIFEGADNDIVALEPPSPQCANAKACWQSPGAGAAIMADTNGDGIAEVIFANWAANGEGEIVAVDSRNGKSLWRHVLPGMPGPHPEWNFGGITTWWVGHYTSSQRYDIWVSARRSTMHSDEAWVLRGVDGKPLWHLREVRTNRTPREGRGWGAGGSFVCSVDVDGDGLDDVVHLYPVNYMAAKGTNGHLIHSIESADGLFPGVWGAYAQPLVADFNADGKNEVLWCGPYHVGLTTLAAELIWFHKGPVGMAGIGDVDGDGELELGLTGSEQGNGLRCLSAAIGRLKWELALPGNPRVPVYSADIDGDGRDEFLFASEKELFAVQAGADRGNILWRMQLPAAPGNLALADVNRDGRIEILFIGDDSTLYCLEAV